jgi:hypothetical protein
MMSERLISIDATSSIPFIFKFNKIRNLSQNSGSPPSFLESGVGVNFTSGINNNDEQQQQQQCLLPPCVLNDQ